MHPFSVTFTFVVKTESEEHTNSYALHVDVAARLVRSSTVVHPMHVQREVFLSNAIPASNAVVHETTVVCVEQYPRYYIDQVFYD
jgi:hypothetical protein